MDKPFSDENARRENPENPIIPQILILTRTPPETERGRRPANPPNPFAKRYNERQPPVH